MHPCNFDTSLTACLKNFSLELSLFHHQVQDKNVLISYVCTHYKCRNETSAWRHNLGITQILVKSRNEKCKMNVNPAHGAHTSFRSPKVNFYLSLSGCSTGSLETCTHVIPMPKLCIYILNLTPSHPHFESTHPTPMLVISMVSVLVY